MLLIFIDMKRIVTYLFLFCGISLYSQHDTCFVEGDRIKKVSYFNDNQIREIGYYNLNKEKVGNWISYHRNGKVASTVSFKNNKKDGEWVIYDLNSNIVSKMFYKNGQRSGTWIMYNELGEVIETRFYTN